MMPNDGLRTPFEDKGTTVKCSVLLDELEFTWTTNKTERNGKD